MTILDAQFFEAQGYFQPRQLPDGTWIGARRMISTIGLFVGLDETGYSYRYCYPMEHMLDAFIDLKKWDGTADPPGMWIKAKGKGDRLNPRWLAEAKQEMHE